MKILATGDWHIRHSVPEKRIDDYFAAQNAKLDFIIDLAIEEDCSLIAQPGDFFDSHKANDFLKRKMIRMIKERNSCPPILTIFGQHDLRYHSSDTKNTPLRVLEAAKVVKILRNKPIDPNERVDITSLPKIIQSGIHIYGASWFEDIPEVKTDGINILVIHTMIIKNEKLWEGQEDAIKGNILLRNNRFDLIISGDNHQSFSISAGKKHLVNCGSLMRMTTAQLDHKPCVYIYDTEDRTIEKHYIPIDPVEEVFDLSKIEEEVKENEELQAFVSRLKENKRIEGLDYAKNLKEHIRINKDVLEQGTLDIIEEVLSE